MLVVKEIANLQKLIEAEKDSGKTVGFVPTMGALHKGHISLVEQAGAQSDFVVVSIFVNPTQFNDQNDLTNYPRNLETDMELLEPTPCQLVFAPEVETMYPKKDTRQFDFGKLETVMEGKYRPGHFNGVAQVVSKLFEMVNPDKAFFGLKDFQQLAVIKALTRKQNYPIEIVPCPTVREGDGLAMSSRNQRLIKEQRENAPLIYKILQDARNNAGVMSVEELKRWVSEKIDENIFLETEYFEIVDDEQLNPISSWSDPGNKVGCVAVFCDKIRLIDNIAFD